MDQSCDHRVIRWRDIIFAKRNVYQVEADGPLLVICANSFIFGSFFQKEFDSGYAGKANGATNSCLE